MITPAHWVRHIKRPLRGGVDFLFPNLLRVARNHISLRLVATAAGYVHAKDRLVQMELQRLAGQGRLSEALKSDVGLIAVDTYFRSLKYVGVLLLLLLLLLYAYTHPSAVCLIT